MESSGSDARGSVMGMKDRAATNDSTDEGTEGLEADALGEALDKMHARDREQVLSGKRKASSLHLITPADARRAKVRWTPKSTSGFKG